MAEIFRANLSGIPEGGVCAQTDPEAFFPETGSSNKRAQRVCTEICDVTEQCLEGALERKEPFGVWGGKSTAERDRMLARRAIS